MHALIARQEIRAIVSLTLPILATQLAQIGMGTIDTIMSGYVSTKDLAAIAVGTAIWMPTWLLMAGILVALTPMASRQLGKLQGRQIIDANALQRVGLDRLFQSAMVLSLLASIICGLILAVVAIDLVRWLDDPEIAQTGRNYLLAIAASMPAAGLFLSARFYAEALNKAHRVTRIMLCGLLLNVPFNAIFVYGWFGIPPMGGVGCGLGTICVMVFLAAAMTLDIKQHLMPRNWKFFTTWQHIAWPEVRQIFNLGLPIGVAIFFEVSLFTVIALLITDLGSEVVAAHQVALNVSSLTFMLPLSLGMALTVRVSRHLGRDHGIKARATAWLGLKLNLALALVNASLLIALSHWLAQWYSPDPAVQSLAAYLLLFAAAFQLSDAIQITAAGALRGYHDTRAVMVLTFISYWLIGLGSGYWLAMGSYQLGAAGFWIGLIIGLTAAAIALGLRLKTISGREIDRQPISIKQ